MDLPRIGIPIIIHNIRVINATISTVGTKIFDTLSAKASIGAFDP